jgi:prepilin-type N-terminal cleavage/methylation domain-containing protein
MTLSVNGTGGRGFTLIELVLVILILTIASTALVALFGRLTGSMDINHDIQAAAQLAQECAEHLLAARRENGYAMGGITDCSALPAFNGFGPPAVVTTNPYIGGGCPAAATCKLVSISAAYGEGASTVELMLADY